MHLFQRPNIHLQFPFVPQVAEENVGGGEMSLAPATPHYQRTRDTQKPLIQFARFRHSKTAHLLLSIYLANGTSLAIPDSMTL